MRQVSMGRRYVPASGGGLVTPDVSGTEQYIAAGVGAHNYTGLTSNSVSNQAIICTVVYDSDSLAPGPTTMTAAYDPSGVNQAMALIGTVTNADQSGISIAIFGLVAPAATGNKTIAITENDNNRGLFVHATSWSGVNQAGGTASFANVQSASIAAGNPWQVTVPSQTNDIVIAALENRQVSDWTSVPRTGTTLYTDNTSGTITSAASNYDVGAASVTIGTTGNVPGSHGDIVAFDLVHA